MTAPQENATPVPASGRMSRRMALGAISSALAAPLVGVPASGYAQPGAD